MDLHITVDKFYLFHLRTALIFAQRKLQTSFFHEKQSSVKSLSQILNKKIFLYNFFVVTGQLFCKKKQPFFVQPLLYVRPCIFDHYQLVYGREQ